MRRTRVVVLCGTLMALAACGERATDPAGPAAPAPSFDSHANCPSRDSVHALIISLYPEGSSRDQMLGLYDNILKVVVTDQARAQRTAIGQIDGILKKFRAGQLIGGTSEETRVRVIALINGYLCVVGFPMITSDQIGGDGAMAVINPTSPTTTVVTGTQWTGIVVPQGAVATAALITIRRLPDFPGPLLTPFDQYPLYYEYDIYPATTTFTTDIVIGTCLANGVNPPDPDRLRLAHNVAPYTFGSVEILPLVATPFLECSDAGDIAGSGARWGFDLASGNRLLRSAVAMLLPEPLYAKRAGSGVGGTVRTFSPFGLVDTLAYMRPTVFNQTGYFGEPVNQVPGMHLVTPTGAKMAGITVDFVVEEGGGSIDGSPATSAADGLAALTSWTLGFETSNKVRATIRQPQGTGFIYNSVTFRATAEARD